MAFRTRQDMNGQTEEVPPSRSRRECCDPNMQSIIKELSGLAVESDLKP